MKSDTGALALDCEHGHAALSSTCFNDVLVAQVGQRLAVPIQFDKCGYRAACDAEFPALTARRNPKNVVERKWSSCQGATPTGTGSGFAGSGGLRRRCLGSHAREVPLRASSCTRFRPAWRSGTCSSWLRAHSASSCSNPLSLKSSNVCILIGAAAAFAASRLV